MLILFPENFLRRGLITTPACRNGIARCTDVVKRAVRMCKRCFKTCVVGGEVLTNGITLCLLVIRSLVEGPPFPGPVSLSLFHRRHGRGLGNKPFLATSSSSRKGSLRRGGVICYLCARNEMDFLSSQGGSAESITFISSASAKPRDRII